MHDTYLVKLQALIDYNTNIDKTVERMLSSSSYARPEEIISVLAETVCENVELKKEIEDLKINNEKLQEEVDTLEESY